MEGLPDNIDLAAITTTSGARRSVVEQLLDHMDVKYLILEKPLFCDLSDYEIVRALQILLTKFLRKWAVKKDMLNKLRENHILWTNLILPT